MAGDSRSIVIAAFFANLGIAAAKFVGFFLTGAASMLAEAVHSLADTGNQGLLLLGGSRARRRATAQHSFGYGRERYFWAFVVAMVLFSLGGLFAIYEGIDKLRHPHEVESTAIAVAILLVAIALESYALVKAVKHANAVRGSTSWWRFIRHSKDPEVSVVLLEDTGAEVGLFFALLGIAMARITGDPRWDALGSLAIGALLVIIAVVLAAEMKSLLIGESAGAGDQAAIRSAIEAAPEVRRLIHLRTQHLGPDELLVGAKIELDPGLTFAQVASAIDATEQLVRASVPAARVVYLEPAVSR
ncbi:MAG: cation diffusion facilitator family transporter [Actinomycetota bacterium]|nr:cation diffusion facilitator family transporter [Actinomycetota bacterium]